MDRETARQHEATTRAQPVRPPSRGVPPHALLAGGNAAIARLAAADGILENGVVHPDVERAIASRAGRGRPLDARMGGWARDALGLDPASVGVHHDAGADALSRSVSARAFTVRNDVFFAAGEYQPHSAAGRKLISHELAHVAQQQGAPTGGPLRVTEPGDAHERHADEVARELDG